MGYIKSLKITELSEKNKEDLEELISVTEKNIKNELFWLPISEESRTHFFDKNWTYFLGLYSDDELIASGALFFNENEYGENILYLDKLEGRIAEIGRLMVLPKYRNRGYIKQILIELVKQAKKCGINYLIATAHPNNIASCKVLKSIGMEIRNSCVKLDKYDRHIFVMQI